MAKPVYNVKIRPNLSEKNSGKCGNVTFCLQMGSRVYALSCSFCPQICLQWESFLQHMENHHDEELRSAHLLQTQIKDLDDETDNAQAIETSFRSSKDLPCKNFTKAESNEKFVIDSLQCSDPLREHESEQCSRKTNIFKTENHRYETDQSFDSHADGAESDQTCETFDEQMDCLSEYMEYNAKNSQTTSIATQTLLQKLDSIQKLNFLILQEVKQIQNNPGGSVIHFKKPSTLPVEPFGDKNDFMNFETSIQSSDNKFSSLVVDLSEFIGGHPTKFVKNCWRKLMRDDIAKDFCWQGTSIKPALKPMSTTLAIKQAYMQKFSDHSDAEFEKCTIIFFQQAKNRCMKKMYKT